MSFPLANLISCSATRSAQMFATGASDDISLITTALLAPVAAAL